MYPVDVDEVRTFVADVLLLINCYFARVKYQRCRWLAEPQWANNNTISSKLTLSLSFSSFVVMSLVMNYLQPESAPPTPAAQ